MLRSIVKRTSDPMTDDRYWGMASEQSVTGIQINQQSAMHATAVMGAVSILSEDVSKLTPQIFRTVPAGGHEDGGRAIAKDHFLYRLFQRPNDWQTWPEFCRQLMISYLLRGNGYAAILRNGAAIPYSLVPMNPDRTQLWETPNGLLFWRYTRMGLHEMAVLSGLPQLISYDDVFHLKDLAANGLVGQSRIALAMEAVALALAYEQRDVRFMGRGARPSGILTTDKKLSKDVIVRVKDDWNKIQGGLANSGGTAVLEEGLKFQAITLSSTDMQFLQARQFQLGEIARMFRVPAFMLGDTTKTAYANIVQQAQDYQNNVLTSHSDMWEARIAWQFGLLDQGLFVDMDESKLLKADITARYNVHRIAKLSGIKTTNEIRKEEGLDAVEDGDELMQPTNMAALGSDMSGNAADGAGRPPKGQEEQPIQSE